MEIVTLGFHGFHAEFHIEFLPAYIYIRILCHPYLLR